MSFATEKMPGTLSLLVQSANRFWDFSGDFFGLPLAQINYVAGLETDADLSFGATPALFADNFFVSPQFTSGRNLDITGTVYGEDWEDLQRRIAIVDSLGLVRKKLGLTTMPLVLSVGVPCCSDECVTEFNFKGFLRSEVEWLSGDGQLARQFRLSFYVRPLVDENFTVVQGDIYTPLSAPISAVTGAAVHGLVPASWNSSKRLVFSGWCFGRVSPAEVGGTDRYLDGGILFNQNGLYPVSLLVGDEVVDVPASKGVKILSTFEEGAGLRVQVFYTPYAVSWDSTNTLFWEHVFSDGLVPVRVAVDAEDVGYWRSAADSVTVRTNVITNVVQVFPNACLRGVAV